MTGQESGGAEHPMKSIREVTSEVALCAIMAGFLGLPSSPGAGAAEPACPCWPTTSASAVYNQLLLENPGTSSGLEFCSPHPSRTRLGITFAELTGVEESSFIVFSIFALADPTGETSGGNQCIIQRQLPGDFLLKVQRTNEEAWACIRDLTKLCRDIGG